MHTSSQVKDDVLADEASSVRTWGMVNTNSYQGGRWH